MNVYKVPGTAIAVTQNGSGNEGAYVLNAEVHGIPHTCPVTVSASTQKTGAGVRRIMHRVNISIPKSLSNVAASSASKDGTEDVTLHAVLTAGPTFSTVYRQDAAFGGFGTAILKELVGVLVALLAGGDSVDTTKVGTAKSLSNGLHDLWPLDVIGGTYGATTA